MKQTLIEKFEPSLRERCKQIWEHKEYDGDGYFVITYEKSGDDIVRLVKHIISSSLTEILEQATKQIEESKETVGHYADEDFTEGFNSGLSKAQDIITNLLKS